MSPHIHGVINTLRAKRSILNEAKQQLIGKVNIRPMILPRLGCLIIIFLHFRPIIFCFYAVVNLSLSISSILHKFYVFRHSRTHRPRCTLLNNRPFQTTYSRRPPGARTTVYPARDTDRDNKLILVTGIKQCHDNVILLQSYHNAIVSIRHYTVVQCHDCMWHMYFRANRHKLQVSSSLFETHCVVV